MNYLGDFPASAAIYIHFTTHDAAGEPVAPSSAFVAADFRIYRDGSAVERIGTAGVSVVSPFDATVGRHLITVDTSNNGDPGFFAVGHDYRVELHSAKTVDGVSQSGVSVATFSIENRHSGSSGGGGLTAAEVWSHAGRSLTDGVTLTSGERMTLAAAIESAMVNEGDATALLQAIADRIAIENPSLGDLTLAAIASAVWANATRTLTSSGGTLTAADVWAYANRTLTQTIDAEIDLPQFVEDLVPTLVPALAGVTVTVTAGVFAPDGSLSVNQGDHYADNPTRITINSDEDLTGKHYVLAARLQSNTSVMLALRMQIRSDGDEQFALFAPTAEQTELWQAGTYELRHRIELAPNKYRTIRGGTLTVRPFDTPSPLVDVDPPA